MSWFNPTVLPLAVGATFPELAGENLAGAPTRLPQAIAGRGGFVIVGFSPFAAKDSERWARWAAERFLPQGLAVYMAVVVEGPQLLAPIIDTMLRQGADPLLHPYAVTTYDPARRHRARFGVRDDHVAQAFLVGPDGVVRWAGVEGFDRADVAAADLAASRLVARR